MDLPLSPSRVISSEAICSVSTCCMALLPPRSWENMEPEPPPEICCPAEDMAAN